MVGSRLMRRPMLNLSPWAGVLELKRGEGSVRWICGSPFSILETSCMPDLGIEVPSLQIFI